MYRFWSRLCLPIPQFAVYQVLGHSPWLDSQHIRVLPMLRLWVLWVEDLEAFLDQSHLCR